MSEPTRILVIDDSEDDRLLYRRALQKNTKGNYQISEAANGEEGLERLKEEDPACVLLDYSMPGWNGVEILKRIRDQYPFTPVIIMTGHGNEEIAVTALQAGAQDYISKSKITPESLERVIRISIEYCALEKRIEDQHASLDIFTRALAHDLKEPIRTIRSFMELISTHSEPSDKMKRYFDYIKNAAERMNMLIDTVYFYTRLDGGASEIEHEPCDVAATLQDAKENLNALMESREAVVTQDLLPQVQANRAQLIQVMQNLLCNAIRYATAAPRIHVSAREKGDEWLISVSDNGPGIESKYYERIFEPFKRLAYHEDQGAGLGLAICRKIIEAHGGKIWCESRPEGGAIFLFTLPKAQDAANSGTMESTDTPALPQRKKENADCADHKELASILLVEDNDADIELTRVMLFEEAHLHCNLIIARDGREALEKLRFEKEKKTPVDLMLLDINMPGMDGFELLECMKQEAALLQTPVVMCTTSASDTDVVKAKSLGVKAYLTKPAEIGKLKSIIDHTDTIQLCKQGDGYTLWRAA